MAQIPGRFPPDQLGSPNRRIDPRRIVNARKLCGVSQVVELDPAGREMRARQATGTIDPLREEDRPYLIRVGSCCASWLCRRALGGLGQAAARSVDRPAVAVYMFILH